MRGILVRQHGGPEVLEYLALPTQPLAANQIRIATTLTSLNFADIQARRGTGPSQALPFVPGLDVVGLVKEVGVAVKGFAPGMRVVAFAATGSYAEEVIANDTLCYAIPNDIADQSVAGLTVLVTAYNLVHWVARLQANETVLIHAAAGGVGSILLQLVKHLGVARTIATASPSKHEFVRALGADLVLPYENFAARTLEHTQGVDVIFDSLGGETFNQSLTCLAPFGRAVIYGHASNQPGQTTTSELHRHNKAVLGYSSGHYRRAKPEQLQPSVLAVLELLRREVLQPKIGASFKLEDAAKAHTLVESRNSIGKVLLRP